jgi:hypothetical protein
MKSKNGTHDFSCNYSTHLSNIKRATKWNTLLKLIHICNYRWYLLD